MLPKLTPLPAPGSEAQLDPQAKASKLILVESARGVAACAVVGHHLDLLLAQPRYLGRQVWRGVFFPGYHGIDFFFVLSGFIIMYAHWKDIGQSGKVQTYLRRRATRILPMYWIVTTALVIAYALRPELGTPNQHDPWNVINSFLLLPSSQTPVLGVAWTLRYEVVFYLVFAVALWRPRWGLPFCAAWMIAALMRHEPLTQDVSALSLHNAQFVFGMLACVWVKRYAPRHPWLIAGMGWSLLVLLWALEAALTPSFTGVGLAFKYRDSFSTVAYGLASAIAIVGMVQLDLAGCSARVPRFFGRLGAASYSVYLTHGAILSLIATILFRSGMEAHAGQSVTILTMAVGATFGGMLAWSRVEAPVQAFFRPATTTNR